MLHNRTSFEDHDEPHLKRHLMRLWLMDWDGWPTVEGVRYHKGEGGITPQGARSRTTRIGIRRLIRRNDGGRRYEVRRRHPRFRFPMAGGHIVYAVPGHPNTGATLWTVLW